MNIETKETTTSQDISTTTNTAPEAPKKKISIEVRKLDRLEATMLFRGDS